MERGMYLAQPDIPNATAWIAPNWPAPPNVCALTTTRLGPGISAPPFDSFNLGNRCGDDPVAVNANRAALAKALQLPSSPLWLRQEHGTEVYDATTGNVELVKANRHWEQEPKADAVISRSPGVICAVLTADCLPLLVCAKTGGAVAAIHAGWRGLRAGVIEACLKKMDSAPEDLLVWLGPAIGPAAYEVGAEVRESFLAHDQAAEQAFRPTRAGHWQCDLYALARQRLTALAVNNVYGSDFCTWSDPKRFYSHRRDGVSGRMASLVWIN